MTIAAQIMIRPYLAKLTRSELLASMAGSMACISGATMPIYIGMGIPAQYLLAASVMAAPGALVISKIVYPKLILLKQVKILKLHTVNAKNLI